VVGNGSHCIIGDTGGTGTADPSGVCKERVETALAALGIY
jgi:hypothetical protein